MVDPTEHVPDSVGDVRFYVPPYQVGPAVAEVLPRMTEPRGGADPHRRRRQRPRAQVPEGVLLCNGRGIHDTSTAELALTLILASLRGVPGFVRDQDRHALEPGWRPALADKRVLLVGYGAIGEAIERRLLPFEVEVVRVARTRARRRAPDHRAARRCCPTRTS